MANYQNYGFKDGDILHDKGLLHLEDYLSQCLNITLPGSTIVGSLNSVIEPGVYAIESTEGLTDYPTGIGKAKLIVINHYTTSEKLQFLFDSSTNKMHQRNLGTKGWSEWNVIPFKLTDLGITVDAATLNKLGEDGFSPEELKTAIDGKLDKTGTAKVAAKVSNPLKIGDKTYDGSAEIVVDLDAFGIENTIKFIGVVESLPAANDSSNGDVVLLNSKEYIFSNGNWVELGDEGSHALKTITITAGGGLSGGGTLEANREISHYLPDSNNTDANRSIPKTIYYNHFITQIDRDLYGHVTGVHTTEPQSSLLGVNENAQLILTNPSTGAAASTVSIEGGGIVNVSGDTANNKVVIAADVQAAGGNDIGEVGNPSVTSETNNNTTTFYFHELKGEPGTGIKSVEQTTTSTEDRGKNIVTVTLTDGTQKQITIQNGGAGSQAKVVTEGTGLAVTDVSFDEATNTITATKDYLLNAATSTTMGAVKIGDNITSNDAGLISITKDNVIAALGYTPPQSDTKVTQAATVSGNFHPLLLGYNSSSNPEELAAMVTNQAYVNTLLYVKPNTGSLYATQFVENGVALESKYVPLTRTINNKALNNNLSLTYSDVGAAAASHEHSAANITSGILPIERGGTGGATTKAAAYNLLNDMDDSTVALTDDSKFVFKLVTTASTTQGILMSKSATLIWDYIKGKADSTYWGVNTSRTKNTVLAAPNGSNGAATFRALVAADIPSLAASKITSGTFDAARIPNLAASKITSGVLSATYGGTGKTSLKDSANALINALSTGSSAPNDADYYVSQYAGGGTTTTTYHRRPVSALYTYIHNKLLSWDASTGTLTIN